MDKSPLDMSLEELLALKRSLDPEQVTQEQMVALDDLIIDKKVDAKLEASMSRLQSQETATKLDSAAKKRWPQLMDEESEFHKKVVAEMEDRGDADSNPRALLDAANAVGLELGEVPGGWTPSPNVQKAHALKPSGDEDAVGDGKPKLTEKHEGVFKRLVKEGYLPDSEETVESINARAGEEK